MSGQIQNPFHEIALDRDLLQSEFKFQTNWHVITGAPCSGKTTIIDLLKNQGFHTVPEVGRIYIENELAKGRSLDEIRRDQAEFNRRIFELTLERESMLNPEDVYFLDRGIPDSPAYYRAAGMNPQEALPDCFRYHYLSVFILDRLPCELDGVRDEDDATAKFIDYWMERDYSALGYDILRVPLMQPETRLSYILDSMQ